MKNIYDMLNDVEVDLGEFEKEDFNDIEKQRIKKKFRKSINSNKVKKNSYKKYITVASVAVVSLVIFSQTQVGAYANEVVTEIVYSIKEALGVKGDLSSYTTNINQSVTKRGLIVKINEVLLDRDELIIHMTKTYDKKLKEGDMIELISENLYINGKKVTKGTKGYYTKRDEYSEEFIIGYKLNKSEYEEDIKVNLRIMDAYVGKDYENSKRIIGPWKFKFKVNNEKLRSKTKEININKQIDLDTGSTMIIEKYRSNILRSEIHAIVNVDESIEDKSYGGEYGDIILKGKDDLGNEIEFYVEDGSYFEKEGKYTSIYQPLEKYKIDKNAKKLYLTPYLSDFVENDDEFGSMYKKVGKEFVLDI